jgi:hypothetical protein
MTRGKHRRFWDEPDLRGLCESIREMLSYPVRKRIGSRWDQFDHLPRLQQLGLTVDQLKKNPNKLKPRAGNARDQWCEATGRRPAKPKPKEHVYWERGER